MKIEFVPYDPELLEHNIGYRSFDYLLPFQSEDKKILEYRESKNQFDYTRKSLKKSKRF